MGFAVRSSWSRSQTRRPRSTRPAVCFSRVMPPAIHSRIRPSSPCARCGEIELPQGLALDVKRESGTVLIPFNDVFIHEMRRAERTVVIAPPDGLLD